MNITELETQNRLAEFEGALMRKLKELGLAGQRIEGTVNARGWAWSGRHVELVRPEPPYMPTPLPGQLPPKTGNVYAKDDPEVLAEFGSIAKKFVVEIVGIATSRAHRRQLVHQGLADAIAFLQEPVVTPLEKQ